MEEHTPQLSTPSDRQVTPHVPDGAAPPVDHPAGAQVPLPFDDEAHEPIPFALTARARRTVAPEALPSLRVVTTLGSTPSAPDVDDDPSDTRPARARALRRAGVERAAIADQLGVDELLVRAWTADVVAAKRTSRAAAAGDRRPLHPGGTDPGHEEARTSFELARAEARDRARQRLADDPRLTAGLGVLAGIAELDPAAVTVTTADPRLAGAVVRWLVDVLDADPAAVRLVLRVGPRAAADLARHRWGRAVGMAPDRVRTTRAGAPADPDAVEGVLRIVDADLAAAAAGWRDALLDDEPAVDATF